MCLTVRMNKIRPRKDLAEVKVKFTELLVHHEITKSGNGTKIK